MPGCGNHRFVPSDSIHVAPSILCRLNCWMVNLTNSLIFSICLMFTKSLWEWSPMHQKLTGQCTMRVSDFWIYPIYHMKLVFSTTFTQMVQHTIHKLVSNSVNLQAVWFHITLLYGSFLFLYPLIFLKILLLFFKNFGIFIRVGKKGSFGPWSRVMVCCSKPSFCQNDPPSGTGHTRFS